MAPGALHAGHRSVKLPGLASFGCCLPDTATLKLRHPCCTTPADEAGRGPVLGPMVYAGAFCPVAAAEELKKKCAGSGRKRILRRRRAGEPSWGGQALHAAFTPSPAAAPPPPLPAPCRLPPAPCCPRREFADSKTLSEEKREHLFEAIRADPGLGHLAEVLPAALISARMLSRERVSLNTLANDATFKVSDLRRSAARQGRRASDLGARAPGRAERLAHSAAALQAAKGALEGSRANPAQGRCVQQGECNLAFPSRTLPPQIIDTLLARGVNLTEVYVDTVGDAGRYQVRLGCWVRARHAWGQRQARQRRSGSSAGGWQPSRQATSRQPAAPPSHLNARPPAPRCAGKAVCAVPWAAVHGVPQGGRTLPYRLGRFHRGQGQPRPPAARLCAPRDRAHRHRLRLRLPGWAGRRGAGGAKGLYCADHAPRAVPRCYAAPAGKMQPPVLAILSTPRGALPPVLMRGPASARWR